MMTQYQKVSAQVHLLIGAQPISIAFETDAGAEAQWKIITGMLRDKKYGDYVVVTHSGGCVWVDLMSVNAVTWTKEQRIAGPGLAAMPPPNMLRS